MNILACVLQPLWCSPWSCLHRKRFKNVSICTRNYLKTILKNGNIVMSTWSKPRFMLVNVTPVMCRRSRKCATGYEQRCPFDAKGTHTERFSRSKVKKNKNHQRLVKNTCVNILVAFFVFIFYLDQLSLTEIHSFTELK